MIFTKMHGIGNDYVYVDCTKSPLENPAEISIKISDRHFGIGSDGLILICPSKVADFKMEMYNKDGSWSEMCGNGIRCVAKYVYDHKMTDKTEITIETGAGIKTLKLEVENGKMKMARVDMGEPILEPEKIPVIAKGERVVSEILPIEGLDMPVTCVSMGNPHAVIFMDTLDHLEIEKLGPMVENAACFPKKTNVEFIEVISKEELRMRVWERGSNETYACGTGSCGAAVAAMLNGYTNRKVRIHLLGGDLDIEWNEDNNHVYMTGPAKTVFTGEIDLNEL